MSGSAAADGTTPGAAFDRPGGAGAGLVAAVPSAPSADCSVWRSTISAALRSGALDDGTEPAASDASRKIPDFWNAFLISPPSRFWSRLVCCASTCAIACCNFGGRLPDEAAAPRLANNGARLSCSVAPLWAATDTAARSTGVNTFLGATIVGQLAAASTNASGDKVTASA